MNPPIRRPIRIWMTGCAAVVMAALTTSPARSRTLADDESERQRGRSALLSPYDVTETVCKIEAAAAAHGLKLFARVDQRASAATLVLASSDGVTPVMQGAGAAAIVAQLGLKPDEIKAVESPEIRRGLLKRIADRFVGMYRDRVGGGSLAERMTAVAGVMGEREIPFVVDTSGELPVLSALACPYPELAKRDRGVCTMEKMMLSEMLGENVRLSECRLDGATCCTFTPGASITN